MEEILKQYYKDNNITGISAKVSLLNLLLAQEKLTRESCAKSILLLANESDGKISVNSAFLACITPDSKDTHTRTFKEECPMCGVPPYTTSNDNKYKCLECGFLYKIIK